MYFVPQDTTPIHFHLVEHPKMMIFQLVNEKTRIYLEPSNPHPAEPHVRPIRGFEPGGSGYYQEYRWKVEYGDELQTECPVKLYWIGSGQEVIFHYVCVPLTILKLVGYYSHGIPYKMSVLLLPLI